MRYNPVILWTAVVVFIASFILLRKLIKDWKKENRETEEMSQKKIYDPFSLLTSNLHRAQLSEDPTREEVLEYPRRSGGRHTFVIILKLRNGSLIPCITQVTGDEPCVFFKKEDFERKNGRGKAAWKSRHSIAEKILSAKAHQEASLTSITF